jgi:hypothetical protein
MERKFVTINNRVFMIVKPVKKLFQSDMVHDVITSGRSFAVDMNTGELTIVNLRKPEESTVQELFKDRLRVCFEILDSKNEVVWNSKLITVLEFQDIVNSIPISVDHTLAKTFRIKFFYYKSPNAIPVEFELETGRWAFYDTENSKVALTNIRVLSNRFNKLYKLAKDQANEV